MTDIIPTIGDYRETGRGGIQIWNGVEWTTPDTRTPYQRGFADGATRMRDDIFQSFETYMNHHGGCALLNDSGKCDCGFEKLEHWFNSMNFKEWI